MRENLPEMCWSGENCLTCKAPICFIDKQDKSWPTKEIAERMEAEEKARKKAVRSAYIKANRAKINAARKAQRQKLKEERRNAWYRETA